MTLPGQDLQLRLLEQLATYKYLCINQFIQLGATVTKKTLRRHLQSLKERHLCDVHEYRIHPKQGRLESVYFLKPKGKWYVTKFCGFTDDAVKLPKGKLQLYDQYEHRKKTISVHIALRLACLKKGIILKRVDAYFEKQGRIRSTKITRGKSFLIPDIIILAERNLEDYLFCIELHRQYRVTRITNQLRSYIYALAQGSPSIKYDLGKSARILVVFEEQSTLWSTLEVAQKEALFTHFKEYFLFKEYEQLLYSPLQDRFNLKKEKVALYPSA